jgi:hypothetical protein
MGPFLRSITKKGSKQKKQGWMMNDVIDKPVMVEFPYSAKIDPHVINTISFCKT